MRVVFVAGGTGGHIMPALTVAKELVSTFPQSEVLFIGVGKEVESRLIGGAGFTLKTIPFPPLVGAGVKGILRSLVIFPRSFLQCVALLRKFKPQVVLGFGGYPSVVPLLAAKALGITALLHEQNCKAGAANRLLAHLVRRVYAVHGVHGFSPSIPVTEIGNPIREEFFHIPPWTPPQEGEPYRIAVVGGSQGAVSLNTAVLDLLPQLRGYRIHITHQSGENDLTRLTEGYQKVTAGWPENDRALFSYEVLPFIQSIVDVHASSHLIICRGGALTVAEVSAAGRPAIFVPLAISRAHQSHNVRPLLSAGGALMLAQNEALSAELASTIKRLLGEPQELRQIAERAGAFSRLGGTPASSALVDALEAYTLLDGRTPTPER